MADRAIERPFPWLGLCALGAGSFSMVTVEILPTGVLPQIARDFGTSEALIGALVSVFAFAVVLFSAPLTQITRRLPRKALVVTALAVATLAGFAAAAAPNFIVLALIRVVGGAAHGLFWSVVGAYPSYLVPPDQVGKAIALNSAGSSLAGVVGLPLGTFLGHAFGWRASFVIVSAIGAVALLVLTRYLPAVHGPHESRAGTPGGAGGAYPQTSSVPILTMPVSTATSSVPIVTSSIPVMRAEDMSDVGDVSESTSAGGRRDQGVWSVVVICLMIATFMAGSFAFSTFVAPYMRDVIGMPEDALSLILLGQGIVGTVGVLLCGWLFAARPRRWLLVSMAAQVVLVSALWMVGGAFAPGALTLFYAMAFVGGAIPMLSQTVMLRVAPMRIRDVSLSFYTASFNVGIGAGAAMGALIVQGAGVRTTALAAGVFALVSLALFFSYTVRRRGNADPVATS